MMPISTNYRSRDQVEQQVTFHPIAAPTEGFSLEEANTDFQQRINQVANNIHNRQNNIGYVNGRALRSLVEEKPSPSKVAIENSTLGFALFLNEVLAKIVHT